RVPRRGRHRHRGHPVRPRPSLLPGRRRLLRRRHGGV
ncbi:uncharacterized protein METZ01_LOCUS109455, partial [marine metagenome]